MKTIFWAKKGQSLQNTQPKHPTQRCLFTHRHLQAPQYRRRQNHQRDIQEKIDTCVEEINYFLIITITASYPTIPSTRDGSAEKTLIDNATDEEGAVEG